MANETKVRTKKSHIGTAFLKRTAGLITGAAGDYISEAMPVTSSVYREAKESAKDGASFLINTSKEIFPKARQIKKQLGLKKVLDWYMGEEDELSDDSEDSNIKLDIDTDEEHTDIEIANTTISETEKASNKMAKALVSSSKKQLQGQIELTSNIITSIDKQTEVISGGFNKLNKTLEGILEVVTKNTAAIVEATVANGNNEPDHRHQLLDNGGKFNFKQYIDMIKKNASEESSSSMFGMILPYLSMLKDKDTRKQFLSPESITKLAFGGIMNKFMPGIKEGLKALDESFNESLMTGLIRLGENRSSGLKGTLARIFGIDSTKKDFTVGEKKELELKAVAFDSITKEAITNTIPGYLKRILEAVSGKSLEYDYRARKFKTREQMQRDFMNVATGSNHLSNASEDVRRTFGGDGFAYMLYDMIITDLGYETGDGRARDMIASWATNPNKFEKYVKGIFANHGMQLKKQELNRVREIAKNMGNPNNTRFGAHMSNDIAVNNHRHNQRIQKNMEDATNYNLDYEGFSTDKAAEIKNLAKIHGKKFKDNTKLGASISGSPNNELTGVNYTNKALYEIFQLLNRGINVYRVGKDDSRKKQFPKWKLTKPSFMTQSQNKQENEQGPETHVGQYLLKTDGTVNLLNEEFDEDGNELTKGKRFARWAKQRGGALTQAIFSGDKDAIKAAFGNMVGDISEVAGDSIKKGLSKINDSFGNVTGYLKHKFFGSEYSYQDGVDENGKPIIKHIKENKNGGYLGFAKDYFKDIFSEKKAKFVNWFNSVKGYFDYGEKDEDGNKTESDVVAKRKKLISASIGAFSGLGILGGPLGLIAGTLAGYSLQGTGFSKKIKSFLFGDKEKGKKGLLGRVGDHILDPIRYQMSKTTHFVAERLKKNIIGPLSDIGYAIKERAVSETKHGFRKAMGIIGKIITAPFKLATKPLLLLKDKILKPLGNIGYLIKETIKNGVKTAVSATGRAVKSIVTWPFKKTAKLLSSGLNLAKEKIIKPLADIGRSIKDKFTGAAKDGAKKIISKIGDIITAPIKKFANTAFAKMLGKIIMAPFRAGKTALFGIGRGVKSAAEGLHNLSEKGAELREKNNANKDRLRDKIGPTALGGKLLRGILGIGGSAGEFGLNRIANFIGGSAAKEGLKERRKERDKAYKKDKKNLYGFYLRDEDGNIMKDEEGHWIKNDNRLTYSSWKKDKQDKRAKRWRKRKDYTAEVEYTQEEWAAKQAEIQQHQSEIAEKHKDIAEKTYETNQEISQKLDHIIDNNQNTTGASVNNESNDKSTGQQIGGSSINVTSPKQSQIVNEDYQKLAADIYAMNDWGANTGADLSEFVTSEQGKKAQQTGGASISGTDIAISKQDKINENNESFANAAMGAAVTAASTGGITESESKVINDIAKETAKSDSKPTTILGKLKNLFKKQEEKVSNQTEEEHSFLSDLLSGAGSSVLGGLGSLLKNFWPLILGGLALFSDKFRDLIFDGVKELGSWLTKNLPNILKGAWNLIKGIGDTVNTNLEASATNSEAKVDEVTGNSYVETSAEQHAEDKKLGSTLTGLRNTFTLEEQILNKTTDAAMLGAAGVVSGVTGGAMKLGGKAVNWGANTGIATTHRVTKALNMTYKEAVAQYGETYAKQLFESTAEQLGKSTFGEGAIKAGDNLITFGKTGKSVATKSPGKLISNIKEVSKGSKFFAGAPGFLMSVAMDTDAATSGWDKMETDKNGNYVGTFGFDNAGGYARTSVTAKRFISAGLGIGGALASTILIQMTNPVTIVAALIEMAVAVRVWILGQISNLLYGWISDAADRSYAIRTNSVKVRKVVNEGITYNDEENPMYVHFASEGDRVVGLTKGTFYKDPELLIGRMIYDIKNNRTTMEGAEVLFYELLNNMAIVGVPFACYVAGDSDTADAEGKHANMSFSKDAEVTEEDWIYDNTQVTQSYVKKHKEAIFADIQANLERLNSSYKWDDTDLEAVYNVGQMTVGRLKRKGILDDDRTVNTKLFEKSIKDKDVGTKNKGWKALAEIARDRNDIYALHMAICYINSRIKCDNDTGEQWVQKHQMHLVDLMDELKDVIKKVNNDNRKMENAAVQTGNISLADLTKQRKDLMTGKGKKATEGGNLTIDNFSYESIIKQNKVPTEDLSKVSKELRYITTSWLYANPTTLANLARNADDKLKISMESINQIPNWKSIYKENKVKGQMLFNDIKTAAAEYANTHGDIFNLIPLFDWSKDGNFYNSAYRKEYGGAAMLRPWGLHEGESGTLEYLWNSDSDFASNKFTPEDMQEFLYGDDLEGASVNYEDTDAYIPKILNNIESPKYSYPKDIDESLGYSPSWGSEYAYSMRGNAKPMTIGASINEISAFNALNAAKKSTDSDTGVMPIDLYSNKDLESGKIDDLLKKFDKQKQQKEKDSKINSKWDADLHKAGKYTIGTDNSTLSKSIDKGASINSYSDYLKAKSGTYFSNNSSNSRSGPITYDTWKNQQASKKSSWFDKAASLIRKKIGGASISDDLAFNFSHMGGDSSSGKVGGNPLSKPFEVSSPYGDRDGGFHRGIDLITADHTGEAEVSARYSGTVTEADTNVPDSDSGYPYQGNHSRGNTITIQTDDGQMQIKVMHLKGGSVPSDIKVGSKIQIGQKLGNIGSTGSSTGPHLHYQLEKNDGNGNFVDYDPASDVQGEPHAPTSGGSSVDSSSDSTVGTSSQVSGPIGKLIEGFKKNGHNFLDKISGGMFGEYVSVTDEGVETTGTATSSGGSGLSNSSGNDHDADKNAARVYKRLKSLGISDVNIAGALGNFKTESGVDPTSVEGFYGDHERYEYGPDKQKAMNDHESYFWNLKSMYDNNGLSINTDAYKGEDGKYYPGLGLAQFTGPAATQLIDKAKSLGMNWYDMDANLAYGFPGANDSGPGYRSWFTKDWTDHSSVSDATRYFLKNYEGCTPNSTPGSWPHIETRVENANYYYDKMKSGWPNNTGGPSYGADSKMSIIGGNPLSKSAKITSGFGSRAEMGDFHRGIDITPADGSDKADVKSQFNGTVLNVKNNVPDSDSGYPYHGKNSTGNAVSIKTDSGQVIKNYHLKAGSIPANIKPGMRIGAGDKIGEIGSTGNSTGPHLHYQIENGNSPLSAINPLGGAYSSDDIRFNFAHMGGDTQYLTRLGTRPKDLKYSSTKPTQTLNSTAETMNSAMVQEYRDYLIKRGYKGAELAKMVANYTQEITKMKKRGYNDQEIAKHMGQKTDKKKSEAKKIDTKMQEMTANSDYTSTPTQQESIQPTAKARKGTMWEAINQMVDNQSTFLNKVTGGTAGVDHGIESSSNDKKTGAGYITDDYTMSISPNQYYKYNDNTVPDVAIDNSTITPIMIPKYDIESNERNNDITNNPTNNYCNNNTDVSELKDIMKDVLLELRNITGNTSTSNSWLESINGKEFKDQGLRDSINALGKATSRSKTTNSKRTNVSNAKTVYSMARP